MQQYFSTISSVYKDVKLEVKKKHRLTVEVYWINSVNGRTLMYGTTSEGDTVFLFIVSKECKITALGEKFSSMSDIVPEGVEGDIRDADHLLFIKYRKEFKIKKSNSFRVVGSAIYHNRKTTKSTVIQELATVCTCNLK